MGILPNFCKEVTVKKKIKEYISITFVCLLEFLCFPHIVPLYKQHLKNNVF